MYPYLLFLFPTYHKTMRPSTFQRPNLSTFVLHPIFCNTSVNKPHVCISSLDSSFEFQTCM